MLPESWLYFPHNNNGTIMVLVVQCTEKGINDPFYLF